MTSSLTSNFLSGSNPRIFLTAATSSSPSADAVRLAGVHQLRRRVADDRPQRDERRLVGDRLGLGDGLFDGDDVLAALDVLHVPAVGLVASGGVLAQRDVGVVLDRDLVVVVEHDEVAQLLHGGQRRRLRGHALFHVAVGGDHVDVVVERAGPGRGVRVEQAALVARRHREADRGRQALAEGAGGDLHALGVPELRVPGRLGSPGAQRLDVGQLQPEPAQVELEVQGQAAVPTRQHEPVAAQPVRVARVVRASPAGTACRQAAQGSSPSRDGRCPPSGPRRRPALARCRQRPNRARSSRRGGAVGSGSRCLRVWSLSEVLGSAE